jgi:DNA processing protein
VEDIVEVLSLPDRMEDEGGAEAPARMAPKALTTDEDAILQALSLQQRHVDEVIQECRLSASRASAGLLMLELKGLVRRLPGNMFMRVS